MKIQCQNCGVEHEIDPPSWVVSSGRAFRFRCSSCGYSQSVQPPSASETSLPPNTEPPSVATPHPSFPPPDATPRAADPGDAAPPPVASPPVAAATEPPVSAPPPVSEPPPVAAPQIIEDSGRPVATTPWEEQQSQKLSAAARLGLAPPKPPEETPAEPAEEDPTNGRGVTGPTITPWEDTQTPPSPVANLSPAPDEQKSGGAVFLKQNGQIYMVSDWATLKRWIAESRVDRHDLVSEGGVRWEPIGSRPDLLPSFAGTEVTAASEPTNAHFPFGGETPFGGDYKTASGWHDDDTEGIPTGLPPLPTDEVPQGLAPTGFDAIDVRKRKMTPTPPPVARRQPPPVQRPSFVPPPPPEPEAGPSMAEADRDTEPHKVSQEPEREPEPSIAPPALPDTVPPAPLRANPSGPAVQTGLGESTPTMETEVVSRPNPVSDHDLDIDFYDQNTDELVLASRPNNTPLMLAGCATLLMVATFLLFVGYNMRPQGPTPDPAPVLPLKPAPVVPTPPPTNPEPQPEQPDPADPQPDTQPDAPTPGPVPDAPEPGPVPTQPDPPSPGPVTPPSPPSPPTPRPANVSSLVNRGWNLADSDPNAAKAVFKKALDAAPGNVDANYGYGYALLKSGDKASAATYLCKASARGNTDTKREIKGMLDTNGMSCP